MFGRMKIYRKSIVKLQDEVMQHLVNEAWLQLGLDITHSQDLQKSFLMPPPFLGIRVRGVTSPALLGGAGEKCVPFPQSPTRSAVEGSKMPWKSMKVFPTSFFIRGSTSHGHFLGYIKYLLGPFSSLLVSKQIDQQVMGVGRLMGD